MSAVMPPEKSILVMLMDGVMLLSVTTVLFSSGADGVITAVAPPPAVSVQSPEPAAGGGEGEEGEEEE